MANAVAYPGYPPPYYQPMAYGGPPPPGQLFPQYGGPPPPGQFPQYGGAVAPHYGYSKTSNHGATRLDDMSSASASDPHLPSFSSGHGQSENQNPSI
jgi:hypothetical protein